MQAEFSENNVINWLEFFRLFTTKEDRKTINKFIRSNFGISRAATNKKLYNRYWK